MELDKTYLCRYKVPMMIFMLKNIKIEMDPSNIISIEKIDDYEQNIRSIIKVRLRIDMNKKIWLLKNKRDVRCKFELDKFGMDTEVEKNVLGDEIIWNNEFAIYFSDEDEAIDIKSLESREKVNLDKSNEKLSTEDYFESENMLDIYLFEPNLLESSNKIFNEIFSNTILQNAVARMLTATKHKKVLMSKIENDTQYNELLIPANPLYKCLIYLDQYYGFYRKGAIIYYDVDTLYIINPNGKNTAKRKKEFPEVNFLINRTDEAHPGNGLTIKQKEKKYYVNLSELDIIPKKFSELKNETQGSKVKVVPIDDIKIKEKEAKQSRSTQSNEMIKYLSSANSKYTDTIITARMEENECIMYISADNLDLSIFTPNKEFKLIFTETLKQQKYGKDRYRLAYAYHFIQKESTNYMISSHRIVLKKCAK